jgi:catechol 2,3-dioxygenase-like lactoylglutathione lyase family enzyme
MALEHIGVAARDPAALRDWYVRVLGASLRADNAAQPPAVMLSFPDGSLLEIYPAAASPPVSLPNSHAGWRHLALRVDSLEEARALLADRGVAITEPVKPAGWGGKVLFFSDPEGNLLHLVEHSVDSPFFEIPK